MGDTPTPSVPQYVQPPLDPSFLQAQAKAQAADISATQDRLKSDTAALKARFGQQPDTGPAVAATTSATGAGSNATLDQILQMGVMTGNAPLTPFLMFGGGLNPITGGMR